MAYDIIGIRKEHLDGLKKVIKEAPYGYLQNVCKSVGVSVSMDDIMGHINKGLEYRIISKEDPEYAWKSFLIARMAIEENLKGYDDFLKDVKATLENGLAERILEEEGAITVVYQLDKPSVHHFVAQNGIAHQRDLLAVEFGHRRSVQLATDAVVDGINEHLQEVIHALLGSLDQVGILDCYLFHGCKGTNK